MKVNGVIKVGQLALPEKSPVQIGSVEIHYEAEFAVNELIDVVNLARTLPDTIAEIVGKMKAHADFFDRAAQSAADARHEVEMAMQSEEQSA